MDQGKAAEPQHASTLIALQWRKLPVIFRKSFYSAQSDLCAIFKWNSWLLLAQAVASHCSAVPSDAFVPPPNSRVAACDWETAVATNREQPTRRRPLGANARLSAHRQTGAAFMGQMEFRGTLVTFTYTRLQITKVNKVSDSPRKLLKKEEGKKERNPNSQNVVFTLCGADALFLDFLTAAIQRGFKTNISSKIHTSLANSPSLASLCSEIWNLFYS